MPILTVVCFIWILLVPAAPVYGQAENPFKPYLAFYVPVTEKPKTLASFANFVITAASSEKVAGRVIPESGKVFEFENASIRNGELRFDTRRVKSLSYRFAGRFLQAPPFPDDGRTAVLEGVLERYRNGQLEVQAPMRFAVTAGGE